MKRAELALGWKSISGFRHQTEGRENQDAVIVSQEHPLFDVVMIVADGMGGHDDPKLAAETAAAAARSTLTRPELVERVAEGGGPRELLRQAMRQANARVGALAGSGGQRPGSTLTVAVVSDGTLYVAHAGDGSTMLLREGRLRPLVGGEERRLGNRPQEYLGRGPQLEIEEASEPLAEGDRILICTDGLTRYFGQVMAGGGNGLREVLGRTSAEPQAIANQLTAHSRTDQYDDDTTVVVAEVVQMRNVAAPRRPTPPPAPGEAPAWRAALIALLGIAVLTGAWYAVARWRPFGRGPERPSVGVTERVSPAQALRGLPKEDLVLIDTEGGRFYVLRSRITPPPSDPVTLQAARIGRDGRLQPAGRLRWDPARRTLTDTRSKRAWPVELDAEAGALRAPGVLKVTSDPPGAECLIGGVAVGRTPWERAMRSGRVDVQVRWRNGVERSTPAHVPPGGVVSVSLSQGGG